MRARLTKFWNELQSSYWFIPLLFSVAAFFLAVAAVAIDRRIDTDWLDAVPWLYENRPEGARDILTTIAGSMITIAGVAFSITVASVVYASGEYGPRLLTNFMRDRGNQITLGTFIATFLYCIQVLRSVRGPEEAGNGVGLEEAGTGFVPHIAMLGALVLALCSVGVLIYFIHHVPRSIHISNVIAEVGRELRSKIQKQFSQTLGTGVPDDVDPDEAEPDDFEDRAVRIASDGAGYIQAVDEDALFKIAVRSDLVLKLFNQPGSFVRPGKTLIAAYPEEHVDDDVRRRLRLAYAWGAHRTPDQDYMFLVDELVEIAARALSTGVNDPFTAVNCMDWLGAGMATFEKHERPDRLRFDEDGNLRIIKLPVSLEEFFEAALAQLRPYVAPDRVAGLHMWEIIGDLAETIESERGRELLRYHTRALYESAQELCNDPETLEVMRLRHARVMSLLRQDGDSVPARDERFHEDERS